MSTKTQAEITKDNITTYMRNLTNEQLSDLVDEIGKPTYDEDSIVRKTIIECFGEENMVTLQVTHLLYPILKEMNHRFKRLPIW